MKISEKTGWTSSNTWTWTTTPVDIGLNQVEVWVRDGKHAGPDSYDAIADVEYVVGEL